MMSLFHSVLLFTTASVFSSAVSGLDCKSCLSETWDQCDKDGVSVQCPANLQSYCYSTIGKYDSDEDTGLVGVLRGCISDICPDKKKACNYLKDYVRQLGFDFIITDCNVACCKGDNCNSNTQPQLTSGSHDNVFSTAVSGLDCKSCLSETWDQCDKNGVSVQCPANLQSYCYSAIGKYDSDEDTGLVGVLRGCISDICPDKKKACNYLKDYVRQLGFDFIITDCNVACCKGDNCNSNTQPQLTSGSHDNGGRVFVNSVLFVAISVLLTRMDT